MTLKIMYNKIFICLLSSVILSSCYSFKGASLSQDLKTIQINNIRMETAGGPTNLGLTINEKVKELCVIRDSNPGQLLGRQLS